MAEKKKGKRAYLNDFHVNLKGEYSYEGKHLVFKGTEAESKAAAQSLMLLTALLALTTLAGGFLNGAGITNSFYVILPYVIEVGGSGSALWTALSLGSKPYKLRQYVYDRTVLKLPGRAMIALVGAASGLIGNLLFVILNGFQGKLLATLGYILLKGIALFLAFYIKGRGEDLKYDVA